jgi:hypothetical protein
MAPKLGSGGRFKKLTGQLAAKGASDPAALAAFIGRKKFGKGPFQKMAAASRKG